MATIKELKQQVKEALGFTEVPNEQFTKGRCNGILLNRLNYDSTSFVKATSLQGYTGKEYWEYALVIAKSLRTKKDEVTKVVDSSTTDINLTAVSMSNDDLCSLRVSTSTYLNGALDRERYDWICKKYFGRPLTDNEVNQIKALCKDHRITVNGQVKYCGVSMDKPVCYFFMKLKEAEVCKPYNASIHQFMLAVYLRTTFRIIEECAIEARKEGDEKFNTSYIDVTDFICDVGMTIIHCYDCIPAHWELIDSLEKTLLCTLAEIPLNNNSVDWDYELNTAYCEPLPIDELMAGVADDGVDWNYDLIPQQWHWDNEKNTLLDSEDIDQKMLALAGG